MIHLDCHVYPFEFVSIAIVAFNVSCLSLHIFDGMICMASGVSQVLDSSSVGPLGFFERKPRFSVLRYRILQRGRGSKKGDPLFFLWFPWIFLRISMSSNVFMVAIWLQNKHS